MRVCALPAGVSGHSKRCPKPAPHLAWNISGSGAMDFLLGRWPGGGSPPHRAMEWRNVPRGALRACFGRRKLVWRPCGDAPGFPHPWIAWRRRRGPRILSPSLLSLSMGRGSHPPWARESRSPAWPHPASRMLGLFALISGGDPQPLERESARAIWSREIRHARLSAKARFSAHQVYDIPGKTYNHLLTPALPRAGLFDGHQRHPQASNRGRRSQGKGRLSATVKKMGGNRGRGETL